MSPENVRGLLLWLGMLAVGVALVITFALMPKPKWLDRLWVALVAVCAVLLTIGFVAIKAQDYGWPTVIVGALGLFAAGFVKGWPASDVTPPR